MCLRRPRLCAARAARAGAGALPWLVVRRGARGGCLRELLAVRESCKMTSSERCVAGDRVHKTQPRLLCLLHVFRPLANARENVFRAGRGAETRCAGEPLLARSDVMVLPLETSVSVAGARGWIGPLIASHTLLDRRRILLIVFSHPEDRFAATTLNRTCNAVAAARARWMVLRQATGVGTAGRASCASAMRASAAPRRRDTGRRRCSRTTLAHRARSAGA